jgi:N-acetylneuraminic acid mutarotase
MKYLTVLSLCAMCGAACAQTSSTACAAVTVVKSLPSLPDLNGIAGPLAGISGGALIVAGGANFPHGKPWEGGAKVWYDRVWALPIGGKEWTTVSRLSRPIAYSVCLTTERGVICIGGDNSEGISDKVFRMHWDGTRLTTESCASLPHPLTGAAGALLDHCIYVVGGTDRLNATTATQTMLCYDIEAPDKGWRDVEPWPGPGRMFPVAAVHGGKLYVCSGAELYAAPDGKPARRYLKDAYCYTAGQGWRRIADMPRAAVAAASPAIGNEAGFRIAGGDDGALAARKPWPGHPGFVKSTLCYNAAADQWTEIPSEAFPVSAPVVQLGSDNIVVSGEVRPGVRTPSVTVVK